MIIERRMTKNPVTIGPDANVVEASELMKKEKVHRLPVLDKDKKLVGVISEKDILYATPSPASSLSIHEMAYLLSKLTVRKLMSKDPVTITKDTTVEEAARLMVDQDLSCLPVVEGDRLVGIVSKSDMFKILLELFGARHFGVRPASPRLLLKPDGISSPSVPSWERTRQMQSAQSRLKAAARMTLSSFSGRWSKKFLMSGKPECGTQQP